MTLKTLVGFLVVSALAISAAQATSFPDTVTLPGITNHYQFDDGAGTTAVDSVGGNNAMLQSFGAGDAHWITGMFGGALNYPNENAYLIANSASTAGSDNQFSVSFWTRLNSRPNSNDSVLATPRGDNWITYNPTGNTNGSGKRGIGIGSVREKRGPELGVWESYVVTYDRPTGNVTVYRGGVLQDSGVVSLPALTAPWVFGHNQGPGNTNGSYHGALDEIQMYDRVLTASDAAALASRPPQPGIAAHLVAPETYFGSRPTGEYSTASSTFFVDPATTDWIAWNRFPDLRAVSDSRPGELLLGSYTPEVDDFFSLTVVNPLGQAITAAMDQNGVVGDPTGLQAMIFGNTANAPTVLRGNNVGSPSFFDETGGFNSIFTVAGNYTFNFSFRNIGGEAGYPDVYLLAHTVPEPIALSVVGVGAVLNVVGWRRWRSR